MSERMWHGGVPGLGRGDLVLPATRTGTSHTLADYVQPVDHGQYVRRDRVYVTTQREAARVYAALYPNGALYEVRPVGEVEPDPDCPSVSFRVESAVVTSVVDPRVDHRSKSFDAWLRILVRAGRARGSMRAEDAARGSLVGRDEAR